MPNYKQAPKLYHNKSDFYDKNYYNLPQELMDAVYRQLDGKCGNQIKLMCVLLGTLGNGSFRVSEAWICERTGMIQQTYSKARQALVERGWIYIDKDGSIYVLPKIIRDGFVYPEGSTPEEQQQIRQKTISRCVNAIKKSYADFNAGQSQEQCEVVSKTQCEVVSKTQCEVEYNKINNNKEDGQVKKLNSLVPNGPNEFNADAQTVKISGDITLTDYNNILGAKEIIGEDLVYFPDRETYWRLRR